MNSYEQDFNGTVPDAGWKACSQTDRNMFENKTDTAGSKLYLSQYEMIIKVD
jgi:hypothetical protein